MKKKISVIKLTLVWMLAAFTTSSCTTDKDIKAQIAGMAKTDLNLATVNYTVQDKVVTLTGTCPSQKAKDDAEKSIKGIRMIKEVKNQIQIMPVILDNTYPVKQAVDSVLAQYPTVTAQVSANEITLSGKATQKEVGPLQAAITKLNGPKLVNRLKVE
jgi:osmotically-inducible protein OsmY